MPKIKICYTTKVEILDEIEISEDELKQLKDISTSFDKSGMKKAYFKELGFNKPKDYIEESYIDMGHEDNNCYGTISRSNDVKNITGFKDPYIEDVVFEVI